MELEVIQEIVGKFATCIAVVAIFVGIIYFVDILINEISED